MVSNPLLFKNGSHVNIKSSFVLDQIGRSLSRSLSLSPSISHSSYLTLFTSPIPLQATSYAHIFHSVIQFSHFSLLVLFFLCVCLCVNLVSYLLHTSPIFLVFQRFVQKRKKFFVQNLNNTQQSSRIRLVSLVHWIYS